MPAKKYRVYVRDNAIQAFDIQADSKIEALAKIQAAIENGVIDDDAESGAEFVNLGPSEWIVDSSAINNVDEL